MHYLFPLEYHEGQYLALYVNDIFHLTTGTSFKLLLYGNDATCLISDCNPETAIENIRNFLEGIYQWFQANVELKINAKKTKFSILIRGHHNLNLTSISTNLFTIDRVKHFKLLGVIVDEQFPWHKHISQLSSNLSHAVAVILKLRPLIN